MSHTRRTLVATKILEFFTNWSNWSDEELEASSRKLWRMPLGPESHRERTLLPLKTTRATPTLSALCDPILPPQVSKTNLLCHLDCVGSITSRNRAPYGLTRPHLPLTMAPPRRSPVFVGRRKVVRYGSLDPRRMVKIRSRNNLLFLLSLSRLEPNRWPRLIQCFSLVKQISNHRKFQIPVFFVEKPL
jgi:hypothetical protein